MNYNLTGKVSKEFILDDSEVTETVNIIENITNRKLNIEIKDQHQLQILLNKPTKLIDDEKIIEKVKKFKKIIIKKVQPTMWNQNKKKLIPFLSYILL